MKRKTNFDRYLEEQLKDQGFAERFKKAGKAWGKTLGKASGKTVGESSPNGSVKSSGKPEDQIRHVGPAKGGHWEVIDKK